MTDIARARHELRQKSKAIQEALSTHSGRILLQTLQEQFNSDTVVSDNPYMTHYNLGQRDVVVFLEQVLKSVNIEETPDV